MERYAPSDCGVSAFADVVAECSSIRNEMQLRGVLDRLDGFFEIDRAILCLIDARASRPIVKGVVNHSFPQSWINDYLSGEFYLEDPILARALKSNTPFFWSEVDHCVDGALCESARDFGLVEGLSLAVGNGVKTLFSISGKRGWLHDAYPLLSGVLRALTPLLNDAYQRVHHRNGLDFDEIILTRREYEVLAWSAEGKSVDDISLIVGVTSDTVKFHLKNIYSKLNVENRYHAVSRALRFGLV